MDFDLGLKLEEIEDLQCVILKGWNNVEMVVYINDFSVGSYLRLLTSAPSAPWTLRLRRSVGWWRWRKRVFRQGYYYSVSIFPLLTHASNICRTSDRSRHVSFLPLLYEKKRLNFRVSREEMYCWTCRRVVAKRSAACLFVLLSGIWERGECS